LQWKKSRTVLDETGFWNKTRYSTKSTVPFIALIGAYGHAMV